MMMSQKEVPKKPPGSPKQAPRKPSSFSKPPGSLQEALMKPQANPKEAIYIVPPEAPVEAYWGILQ